MKKTLVTFAIIGVSALTVLGQARVLFNNLVSLNAITVGTPNMGPTGGNPGDGLGNDKYSIELLWKPGTISDLATFLAPSPSSSGVLGFFPGSITGNAASGAGYFDNGMIALGGPAGIYTFLVRAWYNVGYPTYNAAVGFVNTGQSVLFQINATASPTPAPNTVFPSFTVGLVPEPSSLALGGLGLAALFLLRRRS